jgi:signal transduction histidine kinase
MSTTPIAKLLIVDDEAALMTALCKTLEQQGYAAAGFTSAKEALAALRDQQFDLVLTDLKMPEMDGILLLRAAQEIDRDLVGIVMTGHGAIDTAVGAMKVGALDYILKPFKLNGILPVLTRALDMRRLRMENKELERCVRERTAELESANKELEAFSYSVSHDLRAPLRHIDGFAGLLQEDASSTLSDAGRRHVATISDAAKSMSKLIDDLLAFARMGRAELRRTRVDTSALVAEVLQEMAPDAQGRNVAWGIEPLPEVWGDRALLKQVWANLLGNALKYTRQREKAEIKVGCQPKVGELEFHISDNGAGFDMHYAARLFGVFQRLHRDEDFEGTGVGLANVRQIITRHGGRTWAEGAVDRGATFYFSLPIHENRRPGER